MATTWGPLDPGDTEALTPISEFAAKPYTEEEERSLSEIIKTFNDRHGTTFTRADFIRFERVNREIMDDHLTEMLRNNPPDVVFSAFSEAFFKGAINKGAIKMFQRDNEMKSSVLSDAQARDRATRHFFNRALREVREGPQGCTQLTNIPAELKTLIEQAIDDLDSRLASE